MGFFTKGLKDARDSIKAMPEMMKQAQAMQQNAQMQAQAAMYQQQQLAAQYAPAAPAPGAAASDADTIAGVDLRTFADVCRGLQAYNYDQSKAVGIAASKGITADDWQTAMDGWNERIKANPAVAQQFNAFYTGRA